VRNADNLPPSFADVKKSGGLNLLEPCGPVQACNGTAFTTTTATTTTATATTETTTAILQ
jgi:hypothetical protein